MKEYPHYIQIYRYMDMSCGCYHIISNLSNGFVYSVFETFSVSSTFFQINPPTIRHNIMSKKSVCDFLTTK